MSKRKNIPDLSNKGEIGDYVSPEQLESFNSVLCLSANLISALAYELNIELDDLAKDLAAIKSVRESKASNPKTKYDADILEAADELIRRIERAPANVSSHTRFDELLDQLQRIEDWLLDSREDPALAGLIDRDPYRMSDRGRRLDFIGDAHAIYRRYSDRKDWTNKNHKYDPSSTSSDKCTNPFFKLMRICLTKRVMGKNLSQSTIAHDISEAKKLSRTQKTRI